MSDLLSKYEERFSDRVIAPPNPRPAPDKFDPDGSIRPLYGLTCIVWIDQKSDLFRRLGDLQKVLMKEFEKARLGDVIAFLRPESFHMTICDVNASSDSSRCFDRRIIEMVQGAFNRIGAPGKVISRIRGMGLHRTITALVRFDDELELKKVFCMEHKIKEPILNMDPEVKQSSCVRFRDFSGHISLAYCVRDPGENDAERIRKILLPYKDQDLGEFTFSQFDLTYFTDMNTYIPISTVNLKDGQVTRHVSSIKMLKNIS
jgi:hypothetical protein